MSSSRAPFVCTKCAKLLRPPGVKQSTRAFSTSTVLRTEPEQLPRWHRTPPAMQMPVRLRPRPKQPVWKVNSRQEPVDAMYDKFFGAAGAGIKGRDILPEELKWLAITHKSFDQGRRGFNDRLAFLGKRIVDLQTSLALLAAPAPPSWSALPHDQVYRHPALHGADNMSLFAKNAVQDLGRLAMLARTYGVDAVVRWHPRMSNDLGRSGVEVVLAHTMYSIVGAVALQRGGELAVRVARERILDPLGLKP